MKKRILAIVGLIVYIIFIIWFTFKDLPPIGEIWDAATGKNSVESIEKADME